MGNLSLLLLLAAVTSSRAFDTTPTVTFSCAAGPVYTVTVANAVVGGVIFVDTHCAQQSVTDASTQTFTFDTNSCTTVPALDSTFYIELQEFASFNQGSDLRIEATCTSDLTAQTQTFTIDSSGQATSDSTVSGSVAPTITTSVTSDGSTVITSGTVGDTVIIVLDIADASEASAFGYKVTGVTFGGTAIVTAGCSNYLGFFPNPTLPTGGDLSISMTLVRPVGGADISVATATLSIEITLEVCTGACSVATCSSRRRRSAEEEELGGTAFATTKTYATLLVYPPGQKPDENSTNGLRGGEGDIDDVCFSRTPMVAVMICLGAALVICVAISCWMYFKLRYAGPKKADGFTNTAYKA